MNFLAHCALADEASKRWSGGGELGTGLLAGAILADFSKGPIPSNLPENLKLGIRLHRRIDAFSNQNDAIRETCAEFPSELRRYAPIFVDVLADHYLSLGWHNYYNEPRAKFSQRCYQACEEFRDLPEYTDTANLQRFLNYMNQTDLLAGYDQWAHVERALGSILTRLGKEELFDVTNAVCLAQLDSGQRAFRIYFDQLRDQLTDWSSLIAP
jgi:acyl carrier protein phosphodiesterase